MALRVKGRSTVLPCFGRNALKIVVSEQDLVIPGNVKVAQSILVYFQSIIFPVFFLEFMYGIIRGEQT